MEAETGVSDSGADAHIFSTIDRMGKAALDLELLGYSGKTSPKIDAVAANVGEWVKDGGQVVFCDSINLHEKIAHTIAAKGIPREKIGIINGQATSKAAERQGICDDFNAGKLSVVIGNTATMGEGLNLQVGTSDVHHLDLAWEPATMQQRNGRALRQGNALEMVRLNTYLSKGSFDGYRYQTVAAKDGWMNLLWNGGDRVENLARAKLGTQELLIAVSKDPEAARAKFESDKDEAEQRPRGRSWRQESPWPLLPRRIVLA